MADCADEFLTDPPRLRSQAAAMPLHRAIARLGAFLRQWQQRSQDRQIMAQLTERELRDVGLTRGDLYRELSGVECESGPRRGQGMPWAR